MGFGALLGVGLFCFGHKRLIGNQSRLRSTSLSSHDVSMEFSCPSLRSRSEAAHLLDTHLLPNTLFGKRLAVSGAFRQNEDDYQAKVISVRDPSLELAYGEFPFDSVDALVDAALQHCDANTSSLTFVDLGSGAGRVCLYMAMTRPSNWRVLGIEVVPSLHELACQAAQAAIEMQPVGDSDYRADTSPSSLQLFLGPAQDYTHVLQQADIVFCYSTAWDTAGFSTDTGAMVLSTNWMQLLQSVRPGTLVITTDRSCDPAFGKWTLLETLAVENREVMGSIGYVQRFDGT